MITLFLIFKNYCYQMTLKLGGKFANGAVTGAFVYMFNDALEFNGKTVKHFDDDSKLIGEYPATSGRNGVLDTSKEDEGPIPEGKYFLNPKEISEGGFFRNLLGDWGKYRAPLHMLEVNSNRGGFFLHGGNELGSAGCIDIGKYDIVLFPQLIKHNGNIDVKVKY